jgi:hypothetical protein
MGPDRGPDEGLDEGLDGGLDGGLVGARRGGGRKDYLLLNEKMICFVYVSCKSSSAFDVSDARWL